MLRAWRFLTLVLAALALTMTSAHVLELPQKMRYDAELVRGRGPSFGWTLTGAACLLLAFVSWLALVAPVNREVAAAIRSAPESVPALWMRHRARWEYGHATGFVIQLVGVAALLASVLVETPRGARAPRETDDFRATRAA